MPQPSQEVITIQKFISSENESQDLRTFLREVLPRRPTECEQRSEEMKSYVWDAVEKLAF